MSKSIEDLCSKLWEIHLGSTKEQENLLDRFDDLFDKNSDEKILNVLVKQIQGYDLISSLEDLMKSYNCFNNHSKTGHIQRLIIKLFLKIMKSKENKDKSSAGSDVARKYWKVIYIDDLEDFVEVFDLKKALKQEVLELIRSNLKSNKINDLQDYIQIFDLYNEDFDAEKYIKLSVMRNRIKNARKFIEKNKKYMLAFLKACMMKMGNKSAGKEFDHLCENPQDHPEIIEEFAKSAVSFFYREGMPWQFLEVKYKSERNLLRFYCKNFLEGRAKKFDISKSILYRLDGGSKPEKYHENELITKDEFCPAEFLIENDTSKYFTLKEFGFEPKDTIIFVNSEGSVFDNAKKSLLESRRVGIDSEWKPKVTKWDKDFGVSILQISNEKSNFIFDFLALKNFAGFKELIEKLFASEKIIKIFHTADSDFDQIKQSLFKDNADFKIVSCVDVKEIHRHESTNSKLGLAVIIESLFNKNLSKLEQKSDWNQRPLRKTQLHYAALDAQILLQVYKKFEQKLGETKMESFKFTLDGTKSPEKIIDGNYIEFEDENHDDEEKISLEKEEDQPRRNRDEKKKDDPVKKAPENKAPIQNAKDSKEEAKQNTTTPTPTTEKPANDNVKIEHEVKLVKVDSKKDEKKSIAENETKKEKRTPKSKKNQEIIVYEIKKSSSNENGGQTPATQETKTRNQETKKEEVKKDKGTKEESKKEQPKKKQESKRETKNTEENPTEQKTKEEKPKERKASNEKEEGKKPKQKKSKREVEVITYVRKDQSAPVPDPKDNQNNNTSYSKRPLRIKDGYEFVPKETK